MEIGRARAIAQVAQTIIESAKVEVQYLDLVGGKNVSNFFPKELGKNNTLLTRQ